MPYTQGYQTTVIGIEEARLVAIYNLLVSNIASFNTVLGLAPFDVVSPALAAGAYSVIMGDPREFPLNDTSGNRLSFLFCATAGGNQSGMAWRGLGWRSTGAVLPISTRNNVYSQIKFKIHPDLFPAADQSWTEVLLQCQRRARLVERACDWVRGAIFQTLQGVEITLSSQEVRQTGDGLALGQVESIVKDEIPVGYANQTMVVGATITVVHELN